MKISWLSALTAAVEEGSIRAAAHRLNISQPAATRLIRDLEEEIGAPLLVRSVGGVAATAQGNVLYEHARRAMRELNDARTEIDELAGHMVGEISVTAVPLAVMLLVPEAMRTFGRDCPDMQLRLREELYIERLRLLRAGKVDVAVGPIPCGIPASEFEVERLMPVEMAVVVGRGSPLARADSLQKLSTAPWVYTSAQLGEEDYARAWFEVNGLAAPTPAAIVNSTLAMLALITQGDYAALMPLSLALHPLSAPHVVAVPVREPNLSLELGAITLRRESVKVSVRQFVVHLQRAAHIATKESIRIA
ncbi:LysR family transcriptional regulator [Caballeronia sp. ATUFL_M1_KS5A]|uniref:LysR family transcriptional regulator n=1 Tax=Caballeronia sp. ATUFL_M1_KS5A TaxID=2921778 RepID=UPI0020277409|nr:LysR family transcriptional regulator [Caballeronia sp. ATUFL_M1_KS5A]